MPLYDLGLGSEKVHVVLEIGFYHTKVGFAGEPGPRHIIRSYNVRPDNTVVNICDPKLSYEELVDELTKFIHSIYFRYLLTNPKDRKVLLCEDFVQTIKFREALAHVLFRQFSVVGILFTPALPLALHPLGTPTGLVLNIGYTDSSAMCIFEGMVVLPSYNSVDLGCLSHLRTIQQMISETAEVREGPNTYKAADFYSELSVEVLEDIRAKTCFSGQRPPSDNDAKSGTKATHRAVDMKYPMEDGQHLIVNGKIRERSVEVLFDGDGDGNSVATVVLEALLKCPIDCRSTLAQNILIVGGGSLLPGLTNRIKEEIQALLAFSRFSALQGIKSFKFYKPNYPANIMSWVGGSIMACVEHLHDRYISREFYISKGPATLPDWCSLAPQLKDNTALSGSPSRRTSSPYRDFLASSTLPPISNLALA